MLDEAIRNQILDIVFQYLNEDECTVFLFGSAAKGIDKETSDIDVGILCERKLEPSEIYEIRERLNEEVDTLRTIDVIDFMNVNDGIFIKNVLKEARIWHMGKKSETSWEKLKLQYKD